MAGATPSLPGRPAARRLQRTRVGPARDPPGIFGDSFPVPAPPCSPGPLSETAPLNADADLGGGVEGQLHPVAASRPRSPTSRRRTIPGTLPTSLLYMILRQSLILDYANLAATGEIAAGRLVAAQFSEAELIGFPLPTPPAQPPIEHLGSAGAALGAQPGPDLGRLFPSMLDPAAHRRPTPNSPRCAPASTASRRCRPRSWTGC